MDSFDHARRLFDDMRDRLDRAVESMRKYVDDRNKHRMEAIETVGEHAAESLAALHRGDAKPGWVKLTFDRHEERIEDLESALDRENGWVKTAFDMQGATLRKLLWLVIAALIALCGNLVVFALKGGL